MGQIAFLFSGQGDQYPGMGRELYERYPAARRVYDLCDALRPGTTAQCFDGTEDELRETRNTQPCLFAMELAAARALIEGGTVPDMVAGFSLGEVAAAAVSGAFDDETGFRLVCRRGELMQREAERFDTAMAAVVKLTPDQLREIVSRYPEVYPVNFNCPGQITVAGPSSLLPRFFSEVKAAGGRAIPLKVRAAFHSPFMSDAARDFAEELARVTFHERGIVLYSDVTAAPYGEDVAGLLSAQICSPVRWEELVRDMIANGADTFIEIGPGRTLTNMIRKISAEVRAVTVIDYLKEVERC